MRVLVCGGRNFSDWDFFNKTLHEILPASDETWLTPNDIVIISGCASGAGSMAIDWAADNWVPVDDYEADWKTHGKAAGPIRNQRMIDEGKPDLVIAFEGGRGTKDMVDRAKKAGIKVIQPTKPKLEGIMP